MSGRSHAGRDRSRLRTLGDVQRFVLGSADPACLIDGAGETLYANPAYRRVEPHLGERDRISVDDIALATDVMGTPLRQEVVIDAEGIRERYLAEHVVVRDGEGRPFGTICRLVPANGLDDAWQTAEARLEDAAQLVSDWIWETDRDNRLTYVTPRMVRDLGYSFAELIGRRFDEILQPCPLLGQPAGRPHPGTMRDVPAEIRFRDGSRRPVRICAVAVFDAVNGVFQGYRGTGRVYSGQDAREATLLRVAREASAANQAKSRFLADMSHELRTPLNAIMGFSEAIKLEIMGPVGQTKYREYAEDILASSHHLLNLIGDILDISKIEAGRVDLEEGDVSVPDLLGHAHRIVAEGARRGGLDLRVVPAEGLPHFRGDERRLRQVLLNLLWNAVKFTAPGGHVTLSASKADDGGLEIVVEDTGVGMAAEDIATAMTPFSQLDAGGLHKGEGTGLGLPLAKALVELHGGRFDLESGVGIGTTARVRIPAERVLAG